MNTKPYQITALLGLLVLFLVGIGSGCIFLRQLSWQEITSFAWFANESSYNDALFAKRQFVSLNGGFHKLIGSAVMRDADVNQMIVKIQDDTKTTQDDSITSIVWQYDMAPLAQSVSDFSVWLEKAKIDFCYVQAPYKVIAGYTQIPTGVTDYSNENADQFLAGLEENDVDYLDLREKIVAENKDRKGLFYRTDHHWQTKTAFWAFSKIGEMLESQYGWDIPEDYLRLEKSYDITSYPHSFLGSQGKRVGQLYVGLDQYDYIFPNFKTDFTVEIEKTDGSTRIQQGDFTEALVYQPLLAQTKNIETNKYACYFGGDYPEVMITNHLAENDKKILIIKDSFALPVTAFLSTVCEESRMLDLRYFTGSVENYILDYQPDMVLMLYNPSSFGSKEMFQLLSQN